MDVNEVKAKISKSPTFNDAWRELKSGPKELFIIYLLKFLESYSYFAIIYTLIIFLSDEFHYNDEQAGLCYGLFGMCISLYGFLFGGFLIDNFGVKKSLCTGCTILLVGRLLLVVATSHTSILIILYTILPIGTCLGIPVMQIAIRRYTTDTSRSLAYSDFYAMMNVSAIFSASAIDFFRRYINDVNIKILGFSFEFTAYRALFLSGGFTTLCSLLLSLFFIRDLDEDEDDENKAVNSNNNANSANQLPNQDVENNYDEEHNTLIKKNLNVANPANPNETTRAESSLNETAILNQNPSSELRVSTKKQAKKIIGPLQIIKEVGSRNSFWKFVWLIILLMGVRIVYRHLDATFPKYMIREFGKEVLYGSIIAINPFLIVLLVPIFAPLSYQFSAYSQITFGAFITSISPFFLVFGPYLWNAVMFVVVLSIGEALWSPRLYEYTVFITEKGREGIYMALASSPMFIATLVTGGTSGLLLENYCPESGPRQSSKMWLYIGIMTLFSPILLYFFKDKIEVTQNELDTEKIESAKKKLEDLKKNSFNNRSLIITNNNFLISNSEQLK
jgi:MFS family permease